MLAGLPSGRQGDPMKIRLLAAIVLSLTLGAVAWAQDANPSGQNSGMAPGGGYGQRGGRGFRGGAMMGFGRGVTGTVTAVAPDHYTVNSFEGQTYTVNFSSNTRIFKQRARMRRGGGMRGGGGGTDQGMGQGSDQGEGQGMGQGMDQGMGQGRGYMRGNPPQQIKSTDIKVGDAITAMGQLDASAKSIGATNIVLMDPERAQEMQQMEANFGKTWLTGRVTAIDGVKVTLMGPDNAAHAFVANENTDFRERRNPIALTDIHVGDMLRVDGAIQNGAFTAASVNVMGRPGATPRLPRSAPPQ